MKYLGIYPTFLPIARAAVVNIRCAEFYFLRICDQVVERSFIQAHLERVRGERSLNVKQKMLGFALAMGD